MKGAGRLDLGRFSRAAKHGVEALLGRLWVSLAFQPRSAQMRASKLLISGSADHMPVFDGQCTAGSSHLQPSSPYGVGGSAVLAVATGVQVGGRVRLAEPGGQPVVPVQFRHGLQPVHQGLVCQPVQHILQQWSMLSTQGDYGSGHSVLGTYATSSCRRVRSKDCSLLSTPVVLEQVQGLGPEVCRDQQGACVPVT